MSHVRNFIREHGSAWLDRLVAEYKISATVDGDLVSLKYDQRDDGSPMHEPIVQECRGLVVDMATRTVLAHPYNKFWNLGEPLADDLDWGTASVLEKLDGSLMILYWHPGEMDWRVASSGHPTAGGSFGTSSEETFREAFWRIWDQLGMVLPHPESWPGWGVPPERMCFMFELCAAENRIIVKHEHPRIVLHGARELDNGSELHLNELRIIADFHGWEVVTDYPIGTLEQAKRASETLDPIRCEGFVVVDANFRRVKIKSPRYVMLHHLKGEMSFRRAIELWQTGEASELLTHFPEMAGEIVPVHEDIERCARGAYEDVMRFAATPTRKEYAELVKDRPWASVCFKLYGKPEPTIEQCRDILRGHTVAALEKMLERVS